MIKKIPAIMLLLILLAPAVFAKGKPQAMSLRATGYEWLGYSGEEKRAFAGLLHIALDTDKNKYKAEDVIKKLDNFYYMAIEKAKKDPLHNDEDMYLKMPCVSVITGT